jgi:hypothetical protein
LDGCFQCLVDNYGYSFVIIRGWQSFGAADPNCPHTIYNAWAGGMSHVDVYLFPCAGLGAASQVQQLVAYLQSYNATWGTIWLDIETNSSPGCGWSGDQDSNCQYIGQAIAEAQALGLAVGVYASPYMWESIPGSSCTVGADAGVPLWYADYDGQPNFNNYQPFGGWGSPAMKQYAGTTSTSCGIGVDLNWYPN